MTSLSRTGEGNGNPLQCSCLENPRDGGARWAAVYGVAQNRTRLKQLSNSNGQRAWWATVHGVSSSRIRLSDFTFTHWRRKWQPTPIFLPGGSQGRRSQVGCRLWGRTESDTTDATWQQQLQLCFLFSYFIVFVLFLEGLTLLFLCNGLSSKLG